MCGNPVRRSLFDHEYSKASAIGKLFDVNERMEERECYPSISKEKDFIVCFLGGSLGAEKINQVVLECLQPPIALLDTFPDMKIIWQTGKSHHEEMTAKVDQGSSSGRLIMLPFVEDMALMYAACDLFISRSGAITCR